MDSKWVDILAGWKFMRSVVMKKLVPVLLVILVTTPAYADGRHGGGHGGGHGGERGWGWGGGWIFPMLIGGAIAYDLARPQTVFVQPSQVYVQPETVYVQPEKVYVQEAPVYLSGNLPPIQPAVTYWYFCASANGYYPYVSTCPSGWQTVPAMPPSTQPENISSAPVR
jgi:hypothetical protein